MLKNSLQIRKLFSSKIENVNKITIDGSSVIGHLYSGHKRHNPLIPLIRNASNLQNKNDGNSRKSAFDYINDFVKNVIPKVESFVENRLLEKFKLGLNSQEKVLVDDAYRQRKIKTVPKEEIIIEEQVERLDTKSKTDEQALSVWNSHDGKGVSYHTYENIGINI